MPDQRLDIGTGRGGETGRVPPGAELGYAARLRARGHWPPGRTGRDGRGPITATPYLVVPAVPGDDGTRPLSAHHALDTQGVEIVDAAGTVVQGRPMAGQTYTLRCRVANLGVASAYGGIVEFYLVQPAVLLQVAGIAGATLPVKGYAGFVAMAGQTVMVACPNEWTPADEAETTNSVVVHAYDAFMDRLTTRFDARADRHVARRDCVPVFAGVWTGVAHATAGAPGDVEMRLEVGQNGLSVAMAAFEATGAPPTLPSDPQQSASGTITDSPQGGYVDLIAQTFVEPAHAVYTQDTWRLMLSTPDLVHVEHHRAWPGHPVRLPRTLAADLMRP
jgi:hypothetical protein